MANGIIYRWRNHVQKRTSLTLLGTFWHLFCRARSRISDHDDCRKMGLILRLAYHDICPVHFVTTAAVSCSFAGHAVPLTGLPCSLAESSAAVAISVFVLVYACAMQQVTLSPT